MLLLRKNIFQSYHCKRLFIGSSDMPRHGLSSPGVSALLFAFSRAQWMDAKKGGVVCRGGGEL